MFFSCKSSQLGMVFYPRLLSQESTQLFALLKVNLNNLKYNLLGTLQSLKDPLLWYIPCLRCSIASSNQICSNRPFFRYHKVLCPNHYLLLSAKYSLCQIYGRIEGYLLPEMSPADVARKERYCREFLAIIDLLEPGLTRLRGESKLL